MKEGWTYKKLGEVCKVIMGQSPDGKSVNDSNGIEFHQGKVFFGEKYLKKSNSFTEQPSKIADTNSVLLCVRAPVGVVNITLRRICIGRGLCAIQPNDNITMAFLYYALTTKQGYFDKNSTGSTFKAISSKIVANTIIPVPPLAEQERIVAELDLLSSVIDKKKAQLKEYDQLAQSIFYEMFGDPITNEKGWEVKPLGNLCEIKGRIGFRGYTKNDFVSNANEGAISLSPTNIVNGSMDYSKCSYVTWEKYYESPEIMINNGDILLVKTGSSYGKCSLVRELPHEATINPQFVVIKNVQQNNVYITFILSSDYAKYQYDKFVLGTAIPTFSQKSLSGLAIPIPPFALQQEFAERIEAIEKQKALVQASIAETETLFNSRMDYYFG